MTGEDRPFRVEDRRRFDPETGEPRVDREEEEVALPGGGVLKKDETPTEADLPIRFDELVRPFVLMGLTGLGMLPHPDSGEANVSLIAARMAIESLELLMKRTEGNRTDDETKLLEQALYELKIHFVDASRRGDDRDASNPHDESSDEN